MADNRQFADHVEIGGANVYFQETSTTDTTMPSTSFFKTEDVDGKPVIISRDNIMGIVKDCLGSILNGLTDQTTVTKVPTLNGDTLGASAVSTLASVLGAEQAQNYIIVDLQGLNIDISSHGGYYRGKTYELPQGKVAYSVRWDSSAYEDGVSLGLTSNGVVVSSPTSFVMPNNRKIRVYYY